MNFDWVKVPKSKEEEKEQFDKLYQLLVRMSSGQGAEPPRPVVPSVPMDEFTRLKLDILANFRGGSGEGKGQGQITPLETCRGCERSFYSKEDVERHLRVTPACLEWVRQGLTPIPSMEVPFFSFMEEGFHATLLGQGGKTCRFCEKPLLNRRALERHLQTATLCNRLAHHAFTTWFRTMTSPAPLALPAPPTSI